MRIALCCDGSAGEIESVLKDYGNTKVFCGNWDRQPSQQLSVSLARGEYFDLAVVALNGAAGMHNCMQIKARQRDLPVLWISGQESFWKESVRIGVEEFLVKPVPNGMLRKMVGHLLKSGPQSAGD